MGCRLVSRKILLHSSLSKDLFWLLIPLLSCLFVCFFSYFTFFFFPSLNLIYCLHVIGVCLPSQSVLEKHNQEREAHIPLRTSWISQKQNVPAMFDNHCIFDCRINQPFACSLYVICVSCSVNFISTYYAKDRRLFQVAKSRSHGL